MPTITAAQSGAWSEAATWAGGVKPGDGDIIALAGYTVTVDEDTAAVGNVGGGTLLPGGAYTLLCAGLISGCTVGNGSAVGGFTVKFRCASDDATQRGILSSDVDLAGTEAAPARIEAEDATKRPQVLVMFSGDDSDSVCRLTWVVLANPARHALYAYRSSVRATVLHCDVIGGTSAVYANEGQFVPGSRFEGCYFTGATVAALRAKHGAVHGVSRCVFGTTRAGVTSANVADIGADGVIHTANCVYSTVAETGLGDAGLYSRAVGYVSPAHARNTVASPAGAEETRRRGETAYVPSTGYWTVTPTSEVAADTPYHVGVVPSPYYAPIPAAGGDTVALSVAVAPNASHVADAASIVLDPAGLLDATDTSAEAVPAGEDTTLTAEGTIDANAGNVGVEWELRDWGYASGAALTVKSATATVTTSAGVATVYTLDMSALLWRRGAVTAGTRTLNIVSIDNPFERDRETILLCEEAGP